MARARSIKPAFFKNELLAECSPFARLLFAGLWTMVDRDGRMEFRPKLIKVEIFPYDDVQVEPLVAQLEDRGFARRYSVDGKLFLDIPTFAKHQHCHKDEKSQGLPAWRDGSTVVAPCEHRASTVVAPGQPGAKTSLICNPESVILNPESLKPPTPFSGGVAEAPEPESPKSRGQRQPPIRSGDCEFPYELNTPEVRAGLDRWLAHKVSLKNAYRSVDAVNALLRKWARAGPGAFLAAVETSIGNNWKGLFEDQRSKHGTRVNPSTGREAKYDAPDAGKF